MHSSDKSRVLGSSSGKFSTGSGSGMPSTRKSSFNFLQRFRTRKQDKIAADVQARIRAVRAAEELDRRVNAKKSQCPTSSFHSPLLSFPSLAATLPSSPCSLLPFSAAFVFSSASLSAECAG